MASSPASTVSSSDFYAASEPTEGFIPLQSRGNEPQTDEVATPVNGSLRPDAQSDPDVRTMLVEDIKSTSHKLNTGNSNGSLANPDHKRKREEETEGSNATRAESGSPGVPSQRRRFSANIPKDRETNARSLLETSLGIKQIKTRDHSPAEPRSVDARIRTDTLPAELWQHVFRFVPPVFLGRLLRVNRAFHSYLTSSLDGSKPVTSSSRRGVWPLDAETIWTASRKRFAAGLPKPLRDLGELDMWRLLRGQKCQVCGIAKSTGTTSGSDNPWEAGPGAHSVRVIWAFGIRTCGPCLEKSSEKVLISSIKTYV